MRERRKTEKMENRGMVFPEIRFGQKEEKEIWAHVDGAEFRGKYDWSKEITDLYLGDSCELGKSFLYAYRGFHATARRNGYFFQPVLVRYKYLDRDGQVLYTSPITMLMADSGYQMTKEYFQLVNSTIYSFSIPADSYKYTIEFPKADTELDKLVGAVVFEHIPMLHAIEIDNNNVDYAIDAPRCGARFYMPGVSKGMKVDTERLARLERLAIEHFDEWCIEKCRFENPFGEDGVDATKFWERNESYSLNSFSRDMWSKIKALPVDEQEPSSDQCSEASSSVAEVSSTQSDEDSVTSSDLQGEAALASLATIAGGGHTCDKRPLFREIDEDFEDENVYNASDGCESVRVKNSKRKKSGYSLARINQLERYRRRCRTPI